MVCSQQGHTPCWKHIFEFEPNLTPFSYIHKKYELTKKKSPLDRRNYAMNRGIFKVRSFVFGRDIPLAQYDKCEIQTGRKTCMTVTIFY